MTDQERLDAIEGHKWGVWFNSLHDKWVVQNHYQTVGIVAKGDTARQAIDAAIQFEESRICPACECVIDADGCGCNPHDA